MRVLAVDPSSTRTGYAVMSARDRIDDAGYLRPDNSRSTGNIRAQAMAHELVELLGELLTDGGLNRVVIEIPSGAVGKGQRAGAGARLAIYGLAVGRMLQAAEFVVGADQVDAVTEREWTNGVPKNRRRSAIMLRFPQYRAIVATDRGADVADAIELGSWWFEQRRTLKL